MSCAQNSRVLLAGWDTRSEDYHHPEEADVQVKLLWHVHF